MTRTRREQPKKTAITQTDRIRRIKDQKKVINSKNAVKIHDTNFKRFLVEQAFKDENPQPDIDNNNVVDEYNRVMSKQMVYIDTTVENSVRMADQIDEEKSKITEDEKPPETADSVSKDDVIEGKATNEEEEKATSEKEETEEMQNFELVGLSPDSQKSNLEIQDDDSNSAEKRSLENELDEADHRIKTPDSSTKQAKEGDHNGQPEDGNEENNEPREETGDSGDEESDRRSGSASEEESDNGEASENDDEEENQSSDDEREDREDGKNEREGGSDDEDENKDEGDLKSPANVPRRTGFWDHDDRFGDIAIEESWKPQTNAKKLWDKSEVDRWQHDKYVESEQGPKEKWEIEQSQRDHEERSSRGRGGGNRRRNRKFGDFFPDDNRDDNNRRGDSRRFERGGRSGRARDRQTNERRNQRQQQNNRDQEFPPINRKDRRDRNQQNRRRRKEDEEPWEGVTQENNDWGEFKGEPEPHGQNRSGGRKDESDKRIEGNRQTKNESGNKNDQQRKRESYKKEEKEMRNDPSLDEDLKQESNTKRKSEGIGKGRKGKGQGIVDDDFKEDRRAEDFGREKTSREKRIDSLPPRLRDKAREKMLDDEREKKEHRKQQQDHQFSENVEGDAGREDGGSRDKPKRYSSQRQKTGTSMLDIPNEISEANQTQHYLQQIAMLQQQVSPEILMDQQILALYNQLQHQLSIRSQQQMSSMMTQANMGMPMPGMGSPMVQGVDQQVFNNALYQGMVPGASGEAMGLNPIILDQLMAQTQQPGGGVFIPPSQQQQQQQQVQVGENDAQQESRRSRPAAIPIKPPPGL